MHHPDSLGHRLQAGRGTLMAGAGLWTPVLLAIIGLLAAALGWQSWKSRSQQRELASIIRELDAIARTGGKQKLLYMTGHRGLQELLTSLNGLLEFNRQAAAGHVRTEMAIRRMLSNISHDLKTPLTVVLGYIETIRHDPAMPAEERELLLGKVHRKAWDVLELMNAFFDLARLESGDLELPLDRVRMNDVCSSTMLGFYDILTAQGFRVEIDIPERPLYAQAHEEAMTRILNNLISNAIRYGADGRMVGLSLYADEHDVYVEVRDQGQGIPESEQERVFDRMYTLEDSRNKLMQGSGLGLTITKRLVERLGGQIGLTSKPYERTVFTVKLPRMK
ncbi:HAMP domain-containing histidine kinase [Paenibacillus filicis]|uniref:histidine kinase n=1 Tax=Paenibacillus filicis TaxID=669464 RepID=A0ABU9DJW3_9BACL